MPSNVVFNYIPIGVIMWPACQLKIMFILLCSLSRISHSSWMAERLSNPDFPQYVVRHINVLRRGMSFFSNSLRARL